MKKIILVLSLIIVFAVSAAGCSSNSSSQSTAGKAAQPKASAETTADSANQTQIVGNVTSIIGNEVILALGEVSNENMPMPGKSSDGSADSSADSNADSAAGSDKAAGGKMPSGERPSGGMPSGERPSGTPQFGDMPSGGASPTGGMGSGMGGIAGGATVEITLTGESATYLIPVGLSLTGVSGTVSDFSAITEGMSLRLTVEANDASAQSIVGVEVLAQ